MYTPLVSRAVATPARPRSGSSLTARLTLLNGAVDIGQGCKTALRQIAAETLDVPLDQHHSLNNFDTDIGPLCALALLPAGSPFMDGNAVIKAAQDLLVKMKKFAATQLGVGPDQLEAGDEPDIREGRP